MPQVGGKHFSYTKAGEKAAKKESKKSGKKIVRKFNPATQTHSR